MSDMWNKNPYGHDKHCPTCTCNAKANKDKLYQSIEGKDET